MKRVTQFTEMNEPTTQMEFITQQFNSQRHRSNMQMAHWSNHGCDKDAEAERGF